MSIKKILQLSQKHPIITMVLIGGVTAIFIVGITAYWPAVSTTIMPNTVLGLYNRDFWENFLVEAHGFLLDFIMFGVLVFSLDRLRISREVNEKKERRKREEIERMEEELSDYAALDMPEVNLRKVGNIKRLVRSGVSEFNVSELRINGCQIKDIEFSQGSRLIGMQLQDGVMNALKFNQVRMKSSFFNNSNLKACSWVDCDIRKIVIRDCKAKGASFINCNLTGADFRNADLTGATFTDSEMKNIKFKGARLNRADLRGASGLDVNSLSEASSLDYILVDGEILEKLKALKPNMKTSGQRGIEPQHQQIDCTADTILASDNT
ncbi:pentapeptide repeat-containing protein [Vibrio parahaemolyticus]|nr:pentapeptide repeat-containing protein [Vibrio parahaemolyticus]